MVLFQAEDGIRDLVRSRGLGDVYKRQIHLPAIALAAGIEINWDDFAELSHATPLLARIYPCLLYTSDAADERSSVDLGGRRIIKKKTDLELQLTRSQSSREHCIS